MTKNNSEKTYTVELTKEKIAYIKAGIQYWWILDSYAKAVWRALPGASVGLSDNYDSLRIGILYTELGKTNRVKPHYSWCAPKTLVKLCKKDIKIAKKEGEKI